MATQPQAPAEWSSPPLYPGPTPHGPQWRRRLFQLSSNRSQTTAHQPGAQFTLRNTEFTAWVSDSPFSSLYVSHKYFFQAKTPPQTVLGPHPRSPSIIPNLASSGTHPHTNIPAGGTSNQNNILFLTCSPTSATDSWNMDLPRTRQSDPTTCFIFRKGKSQRPGRSCNVPGSPQRDDGTLGPLLFAIPKAFSERWSLCTSCYINHKWLCRSVCFWHR